MQPIKRLTLPLAFCCLLSVSTLSLATPDAKITKAMEIMKLQNLQAGLSQVVMQRKSELAKEELNQLKQFETSMPDNVRQTKAFQDYVARLQKAIKKYQQETSEILSNYDYMSLYAKLYAEKLSKKELDQILTYMHSDIGKKEKKITQEVTLTWMQQTFDDLSKQVAPKQAAMEKEFKQALNSLSSKTSADSQLQAQNQ